MRRLYLITDNFPFGKGEKSFIIPELKYLVENFDVTIISSSNDNQQTTKLDENINVLHYRMKLNLCNILKCFTKLIFDKNMINEIMDIFKSRKKIISRITRSLIFYIKAENFYQYLIENKILTITTDSLFYSYWSNYKLFGICNNRHNHPNITLITRAHGYDLYNDRVKNGRLPFRKGIDKNVDLIVFASKYGRDYYLKTHNKELDKKYPLFKLGVNNDFGMGPYKKRNYITLVSCSNVIPLKRVNLIIEALHLIEDVNINWVHFGSGYSFSDIQSLAYNLLSNKDNISYEFRGYVDFQEIHEFYQENIVDCFITTSSTEGGAPVSIQEAISYGIPIIGTNVGGITEMIDGNGFLLKENPKPDEIAYYIKKISKMCYDDYLLLREKSRLIWENKYDADKNCKLFVDYIKEL